MSGDEGVLLAPSTAAILDLGSALALGVTLLLRLPRNATVLALGLFVCAYALYVVFRRDTTRRLSRRCSARRSPRW